MTVASTDARTGPYDGNGSTTTFAYDFLVLDQAHLVVTVKTTSTGVEVVKTLTGHYSVTGVGTASGGNIVFTSASTHAPSGTTVTITRSVPKTQTTDLQNRGGVQPETLETGYDKLTQIDQDQQGEIDRGLKFAVSADLSSFNTSIPTPVASKAIAINAANNGFELVNEPSASATSAAADAATATAQAALATNYAVKVDGVAAGSDHSAKAWAVGGTGVTDTSSKGAAKEWAIEVEDNTVDGSGYSALHWSAKSSGFATTASAQATLATNYAVKVDGVAAGSDHSSKAWAVGGTGVTTTSSKGASKEWATSTGAAVDTSEYSSKEYAVGTTVSTGSAKQWALGGGGSFTEGTAVAGGVFSAKKYAANAAASADLAASGQIYSTVVNQTAATLAPALSADGTYYLCDTSSNNITVTLPAIGTSEGVKYAFQKTSASNSLIFQRSGSDTLNGSASNITITDVNAQIQFVSDNNSPDNWVGVHMSQVTVGAGLSKTGSVISVDLTNDQSWTGSQRSTPVTDNDGSFDMNLGNNFTCTPSGNFALTFTNITAGQGGLIYLINSGGHTVTKHSSVVVDANLLSTVTAAGTYLLGYYAPTASVIVVTNSLAVS
tara:strand:- start:1313 stop:3133 length:1821 start_codon:yes stop_codon:yes gene_type:complete